MTFQKHLGLLDYGGLMDVNGFFHSVGNATIPTDEVHHFSEGFKPPTSYTVICIILLKRVESG